MKISDECDASVGGRTATDRLVELESFTRQVRAKYNRLTRDMDVRDLELRIDLHFNRLHAYFEGTLI